MVFLVIFGLIAIVVIALNIIDGSNLEKIENHFKALNCQNVIYSKGIYKGICKDEIMQIPNGFSVNLEEDKRILKLNEIKNLDIKKLTIIINNSYNIEFKKKENMDIFYMKLKEKKNI
ncbi:MAG: hypothetical protein WBF48_04515 [Halarcobacter sp.]